MSNDRHERFACKCCGTNLIDPRIEGIVSRMEGDFCQALIVTSGYRCPSHNAKVKGSPTSSHLRGLAADIFCPDSRSRFQIVESALKHGVTRIGIGKNFIHIDIDRQKDPQVIWLY
ncbi:D-Ala-D-Ala carboxypeptidase family metallohydrolase [Desulfatiglans anilini]|uniref:D-Ala-D-Ala carboxypeptidase family metallohydrolase n=1 Tax=Desulfatiglans anilini TaxID=90728 RepID=UPI000406F796|nr:D-Ala-D-Ala carboxypeptidase family metallohydrolase [Desulfatiglans anilini]